MIKKGMEARGNILGTQDLYKYSPADAIYATRLKNSIASEISYVKVEDGPLQSLTCRLDMRLSQYRRLRLAEPSVN